MKKLRLLMPAILVPFSLALSQAPKYSNEFMRIGVGARAFGMAGSVVASSGSVQSGYWNPAGLVGLKTRAELSLMHSEYYAGIAKYDYGALALRIDSRSVAGITMVRFGVDDIPNTLELMDSDGNIRYDRLSTFSVADYGMLLSYARSPGWEGFSFGTSAKVIYREVGDFASAWGFGIDAGARYRLNSWIFGTTARDLTSTFNGWSFQTGKLKDAFAATGNQLPENSLELTLPSLLLGAAREFVLSDRFGMLAELGAGITFDGKRNTLVAFNPVSVDPHVGFEFDYRELVYLRMGVGNLQFVREFSDNRTLDFQPAIGVGLNIRNLKVDYGLTDIAGQSYALYSHVFSLVFSFNMPKILSPAD